MKIIRANRPEAIDFVADKLIVEEDLSRESQVFLLKDMMAAQPETMFVLQAWEEEPDKEPEVKMFLVAYLPRQQNHSFVLQTWADPNLGSTELQDRMFSRLIMWTQNAGRVQIRMETARSPKAFMRRWNFREITTVMAFDVGPEYEETIVERHKTLLGQRPMKPEHLGEVLEIPLNGNSQPPPEEAIEDAEPVEEEEKEEASVEVIDVKKAQRDAVARLAADAAKPEVSRSRVRREPPNAPDTGKQQEAAGMFLAKDTERIERSPE